MRCRVGSELEAAALPVRDGVPIEVRETAPRVAHVPAVVATHVIGDEECYCGEPHLGEDRIDALRQGCVPIVEREQERPPIGDLSVRLERATEFPEGEGLPTRTRERHHLTLEGRPRHARDPELARPAYAMVAKNRRPHTSPPADGQLPLANAADASAHRAAGSTARQRSPSSTSQGGT